MSINGEDIKVVHVSDTTTLASGGTASLTTAEIDTLGFDFVTIAVSTGTIASGGEVSVLKVQESDTSGSGFADVADAGADPIGDADDDGVYYFRLNLEGKKRYLDVVASTDETANTIIKSVVAVLSNGDASPLDSSNYIGLTTA
ncbi:MAG: hypothetical protein AAGB48_01930 [Planctomycetota bacterium]